MTHTTYIQIYCLNDPQKAYNDISFLKELIIKGCLVTCILYNFCYRIFVIFFMWVISWLGFGIMDFYEYFIQKKIGHPTIFFLTLKLKTIYFKNFHCFFFKLSTNSTVDFQYVMLTLHSCIYKILRHLKKKIH